MPAPDLIPSRGAVAQPLVMEVVRELLPSDLGRLADAPRVGVPMLQRLRATHHRQAQLFASGKSVKEIALIVGCTTQRLVQLQNDPTFTELVAYYADQVASAMITDTARLADKIVDLGEQAIDELRERMDDEAKRKAMQTGNVLKIAEFAMDRTVAPPKAAPAQTSAPAAITINFGTPLRQPPADVDGKVTDVNDDD